MFQRINPDDLNGRQKEIYNFQKSAALLADYGFNCIKLTDDWQGADFLAYHFDGATTLKVQLKARLTIDRKYAGQDLWMNFPCKGTWYLVPHDTLVELVGQTTNWLNTSSWQDHGGYSSTNPAPVLLEQLRPYTIEERPKPAAEPTRQARTAPAPPARTRTTTGTRPEPPLAESEYWRHPNLAEAQRALTASGYSCSPPPVRMAGQLPHRTTERWGYEHHRTLPRQAAHPERRNRDEPVRGVSRPRRHLVPRRARRTSPPGGGQHALVGIRLVARERRVQLGKPVASIAGGATQICPQRNVISDDITTLVTLTDVGVLPVGPTG